MIKIPQDENRPAEFSLYDGKDMKKGMRLVYAPHRYG